MNPERITYCEICHSAQCDHTGARYVSYVCGICRSDSSTLADSNDCCSACFTVPPEAPRVKGSTTQGASKKVEPFAAMPKRYRDYVRDGQGG